MNKGIIEPDDFEVGQLLTIHSGKSKKYRVNILGIPFKVKAINLPYIVVEFFENWPSKILDVRHVNFMRVSEEYVKAQLIEPREVLSESSAKAVGEEQGRQEQATSDFPGSEYQA